MFSSKHIQDETNFIVNHIYNNQQKFNHVNVKYLANIINKNNQLIEKPFEVKPELLFDYLNVLTTKNNETISVKFEKCSFWAYSNPNEIVIHVNYKEY
ncbi:RepA [Mycoplasma phage MAV1]|uniref:RepA n=1 Tax=Mycoplasma phage MAV1 TaxID=75590 RepID=UPI000009B953|nr:RepA [Mycoplasma phage MAV1]AAC33768.1 RepA [Mycoplasma phage MAV1]